MVAARTSKPPGRLPSGGLQVRVGGSATRAPANASSFLPHRHPMTLRRPPDPKRLESRSPVAQWSVPSRSLARFGALVSRRSVTPCRYVMKPGQTAAPGRGACQMCTLCTLMPLRRGDRPSARSARARTRPSKQSKRPECKSQRLEIPPKVHPVHICQDPGGGDPGMTRGIGERRGGNVDAAGRLGPGGRARAVRPRRQGSGGKARRLGPGG